MVDVKLADVSYAQYELEIAINAPIERVWNAILEDTNLWWSPDFHMVASESTVEFDVSPGGKGLIEHNPDGSFLQWYTVQFFMPDQFKIYMVGNVAPDWGGPSTTNLCLSLSASDDGCILKVSDAHHGKVNEPYIESLKGGWKQLFGDGLKRFVEGKSD